MKSYHEFISRKMESLPVSGVDVAPDELDPRLYPFQRALTSRALQRGRFALFCDTGTGKTAMQVVWARHVSEHGRVLILAPLAVAEQTVREARKFDIDIAYLRKDDDSHSIVITNYEMLPHFDPALFAGVVLDESSILKAFDGKTRTEIIDAFRSTPFRLACTATPSPNDFTELGNHSEFLGAKTRTEMLSEYFTHDGGSTSDWRLKGHAQEAFWKFVAGWAAMMRHPSDLGFDDDRFTLPPLVEHRHVISLDHSSARNAGLLFLDSASGLNAQRALRRSTIALRTQKIAELSRGNEPVLIWCELNDEANAVTAAADGAVQVAGSDRLEVKVDRLLGFSDGRYRVLVTKPSIAGFGMNWQHCQRVIFAGMSNSFEQTYQAIRRCWRFGQEHPVDVHFVCTEADGVVISNYKRKAENHERMLSSMIGLVGDGEQQRWNTYDPQVRMQVPQWLE